MNHLSAETFWQALREELRDPMETGRTSADRWKAFQTDTEWTAFILAVAEHVLSGKFCLKTSKEYFRVDLGGFTGGAHHERESRFEWCDWSMKVALEHENRSGWRDELCKLTHVVADLCVLISYYEPERPGVPCIEEQLAEAVAVMDERMTRVPDREWLFIFGPNIHACGEDESAAFRAFTLGKDSRLREIRDDRQLRPADWHS